MQTRQRKLRRCSHRVGHLHHAVSCQRHCQSRSHVRHPAACTRAPRPTANAGRDDPDDAWHEHGPHRAVIIDAFDQTLTTIELHNVRCDWTDDRSRRCVAFQPAPEALRAALRLPETAELAAASVYAEERGDGPGGLFHSCTTLFSERFDGDAAPSVRLLPGFRLTSCGARTWLGRCVALRTQAGSGGADEGDTAVSTGLSEADAERLRADVRWLDVEEAARAVCEDAEARAAAEAALERDGFLVDDRERLLGASVVRASAR
jgi:hypothetical protein